MTNKVRRLATATAVAMALALSLHATAQSTETTQIDLPAQPLAQAIQAVARQASINILVDPRLVEGREAPAVKAEMSIQQALNLLLQGTGLTPRYVDDKTITLVAVTAAVPVKTSANNAQPGAANLRLVQATQSNQNQTPTDPPKASEASAEASEDKSVKLEEVVVTAQRRVETLQNVPISISVLGGADLDTSSASSVGDALRGVPGVWTSQNMFTGGTINVSVRGVATDNPRSSGSAPAAYYLDGVPYGFLRSAYVPDPNVYDLDRIEFLRGPQGTLYGAGSLNGVMRVLTHQADVDDFGFKARSYISMTEGGDQNQGVDMAVNVPVIPGALGARLVVGFRDDSGWIDSYVPVSPATVPSTQTDNLSAKDINDSQVKSARLRLRAEPSDTLSFDFSAWHFEDQIGAPSQSDDRRRVSSVRPQDQVQEFTTYALTAENEFSGFGLSSTTSFIDFNNKGDAEGTHVGSNGLLYGDWNSEVFSQEINLVSSNEGPWRWSAGAFYRHAEESVYQFYNQNDPLAADFVQNDYEDESTSYAVYGEVTRDLTETLELAVGLRYFHDDATMRLNKPYSNAATGISLVAGQQFPSESDAVTPRVVLTYSPSKDQTLYASYSQGFRSGIAQQPNVQVVYPEFGQLEPDTLTNYEIGNKGLIGDAFSYEAAIFYIDWQDRQDSYPVALPPVNLNTTVQVNGDSASGLGAEFAIAVRPLEGFELGANVGWNDLRSDVDIIQAPATLLRAKGDRFGSSPEWTVGVNGAYEWALGGSLSARASAAANYQSPSLETARTNPTLPSDDLVDVSARLSIENDHWVASIFGDNLTDENGTDSKGIFLAPEWSPRRRPLTYGLQLEYKF